MAEAKKPRRSSAVADAIVGISNNTIMPLLEKARPLLKQVVALIAIIAPHVSAAYKTLTGLHEAAQPYHIDEFGPAFIGFFLCFFGGNFVVLIATYEAFRTCGWTAMEEHVNTILVDLKQIRKASVEDDKVDADGDGISDAEQMLKDAPDQWIMHKIKVAVTNCDPEDIGNALAGLNSGFIAVIAVLKVQFAKAITLGATIGRVLASYTDRYIRPPIEEVIDELESSPQTAAKYKTWVSPCIRYVCQSIGIFVAFWVSRIISAVHSAIRGGEMFTAGILNGLVKFPQMKAYLDTDHDDKPDIEPGSKAFTFIAVAVSTLGFLFQLSAGFSLFFPLNLIFFPLTLAEYFLQWFVSTH